MFVILSEVNDLTDEALNTQGRNHYTLCEVPHRLRGSG